VADTQRKGLDREGGLKKTEGAKNMGKMVIPKKKGRGTEKIQRGLGPLVLGMKKKTSAGHLT